LYQILKQLSYFIILLDYYRQREKWNTFFQIGLYCSCGYCFYLFWLLTLSFDPVSVLNYPYERVTSECVGYNDENETLSVRGGNVTELVLGM